MNIDLSNLSTKKVVGGAVLAGGLFLASVVGIMSTEKINQGHVGVVYSANGGVEDAVLGEGWEIVAPWKKVTEYPVALETVNYKNLPLATKDGQPIAVEITYNYTNDVSKVVDIYKEHKGAKPESIEDTFLLAQAKDSALEVTSKYTILDIFQKREEIKSEITKIFTERVAKKGFIVSDFVFGTPIPDESTKKAIQSVVDAQQQLEALKIETSKKDEVAKQQLIEAKGLAEAKVENARGTAEANALIDASLTPNVLKKMELEARQKHGWITITGANAVVTGQ